MGRANSWIVFPMTEADYRDEVRVATGLNDRRNVEGIKIGDGCFIWGALPRNLYSEDESLQTGDLQVGSERGGCEPGFFRLEGVPEAGIMEIIYVLLGMFLREALDARNVEPAGLSDRSQRRGMGRGGQDPGRAA